MYKRLQTVPPLCSMSTQRCTQSTLCACRSNRQASRIHDARLGTGAA
ncbi:hypothetical protein PO124_20450 [Bacillus licheniformis]|nr:hypothetical protein [Bacillus licheniformis]